MKQDITIPHVGESVQEALLSQWYKQSGDLVHKDEPLLLIETDKVTLEIAAEVDGQLEIMLKEGETVAIGTVVGSLDPSVAPLIYEAQPSVEEPGLLSSPPTPLQGRGETPSLLGKVGEGGAGEFNSPVPEERETESRISSESAANFGLPPTPVPDVKPPEAQESPQSPAVRRLLDEHQLDASQIRGSGPGGRLTKGDVLLHLESRVAQAPAPVAASETPSALPVTRTPLSPIRKRIAARLLQSQQNSAMLTTFNEIDMSRVATLRSRYKSAFQEKYGSKLGLMSFFVKACVEALKTVPELNAFLEGDELVQHHYYHIGVAVGSPRGLVVPIIRHADRLSFAEIEQAIGGFVEKIQANRLELADLEGGTFTITNGGVFGSLLSTPILNTPQSGILGMHKIEKRPVVVDDAIVIRPMMYAALSYDHRIVDGRESVAFLKRVKECVEDPERLLLEI